MRKFFLSFIVILTIVGFFGLRVIKNKVQSDLAQPVVYPTSSVATDKNTIRKIKAAGNENTVTSLFVPYWTLGDGEIQDNNYDQFIYFGIVPGKNGIDTQEIGSTRIKDFMSVVPQDKEKILTVRMVNSDDNSAILKDQKLQQKIIQDTISSAQQNGFDGILLDLEITGIPFDSLVNQINSFSKLFYTEAKKNNLSFSLTFYGDTFFRLRPYDVKTLAQNADSVMVMAYDFHKAEGDPGPNFPLHGKETYGYDMTKMTDDFLQYVPAKKITVIFGLYGYDWTVDTNGKAISQGKALTDQEIQKEFIGNCSQKNCMIKRDNVSSEKEVRYTDSENKNHIVWFEDNESVSTKQKYLKKEGINSFSLWANTFN